MAREVGQQRQQGHGDHDGHDQVVAGEEAEGDAVVAGVDERRTVNRPAYNVASRLLIPLQ